ncbi:uncharacterized protein LOC128201331 [Galleria mellonella]|uniref:Uncharacterized protein LOC128201331 n=1 Tax=Galleria mellonella TaxID=7137 RepID=A0ABM3MRY7_GALME|nr:uncharacterized protein LOC128201331 [Galleria mellonella]
MPLVSNIWGCCSGESSNKDEKFINCNGCKRSYHFLCLSIDEIGKDSRIFRIWKCPGCLNQTPKSLRSDSTPVCNSSTPRVSKRPALNSPSPIGMSATKEDMRSIIQEVIKEEFSAMIERINTSMINTIIEHMEPIKREISDIVHSIDLINKRFEEIECEQSTLNRIVKDVQEENTILRSTVSDLNQRFNLIEQQSRANNLEIQCMPENKHENIYTIVKQLGEVVGCEVNETDIVHCSRIAKIKSASDRPRSIVIQLASPRIRDRLLAAVIKFNKSNPQNRLNSTHFGFKTKKSPIYIVEHLSPSNKALHAATRHKAKEKGYKYVWVRGGRIFVRKNEEAGYVFIRNLDTLEIL